MNEHSNIEQKYSLFGDPLSAESTGECPLGDKGGLKPGEKSDSSHQQKPLPGYGPANSDVAKSKQNIVNIFLMI